MQSLRALSLTRTLLAALLICSGAFPGLAQESKPAYTDVFDKKEVMIPARDGIKLHTEIYTPKGLGLFPIIF
jgi:predicted acyl esterase